MVALTIPDSKIIKRYFFISCYLSYKQFLIASNPFLRYSYQNWTLNKKFESTYKGIISFQFISDVSQFIHEIINCTCMHWKSIFHVLPHMASSSFLKSLLFKAMVNLSCYKYDLFPTPVCMILCLLGLKHKS